MANNTSTNIVMKWKELKDSTGVCPKPRHGHRCVGYGKYVIIIGGGNEGIIKEINVYNTANGKWFYPSSSYSQPPGCAAFGIVCHETNIIIFGGIYEQGTYSNDIYKISLLNWSWYLCPATFDEGIAPPCPRLGHSFTLSTNNEIYMFGGLSNDATNIPSVHPKYLNDLYKLAVLEDGNLHWSIPITSGVPPSPRESHSALIHNYRDKKTLIIYGGMCGRRLGDIHFLEIESLLWVQPVILGPSPPPRSLHIAGIVQNKMVVFGGWIPANDSVTSSDKTVFSENDWKCTNNVSSLNLETLAWENVCISESDDLVPRPRAGHCGVMLNNRLYIWSGRDGFRKSWNDQVCCKDLWYLETSKALPPTRIMMDGNDTVSVSVKWDIISNADYYIIQIMKVGQNTVCNSQDVKGILERNIKNSQKDNALLNQNRPTAPQGLPALKFVPPNQPRIEEIGKGIIDISNKNENLIDYIDFKNGSTETPNVDISNIAGISKIIEPDTVSIKKTWVQTNKGEKIHALTLIPKKKDDNSQILSNLVLNSTQNDNTFIDYNLNSAPLSSQNYEYINLNSMKNNGLTTTIDSPQSKARNFIEPDEVFTKTTTNDLASFSRIPPPLSISVYPTAHNQNPRQLNPSYNIGVQPKITNAFNEIPIGKWFESIIVSEPKSCISQFYIDSNFEKANNSRSSVNRRNIPLEPNYTYRLRIASVNSCGIGGFSLPLTFSTCAPGLPGPPSNVKIIRVCKGSNTYLIWSTALNNEVIEYSVYISKPITPETVIPFNVLHLKFVYEQIYQGKETKCLLSPSDDSFELGENSCHPYLMLRIVAKNSKGYGPVTQIRWLKNETKDFNSKSSFE
ncbi:hypothetical protein HZS_571, partial [Henneguya salminicola]